MIRDKKPFDKKPFPPKFQKATSAIDKDLFCFGCRSYGHEVTQCNKVGAAILIAEFLSKLDSAKKVVIRKEYLQNRKDAHAKYLLAHKDRGTMKKQIKALEYQIFPTDESRTSINETAWNAYTTGRDEIISTARILMSDLSMKFIMILKNLVSTSTLKPTNSICEVLRPPQSLILQNQELMTNGSMVCVTMLRAMTMNLVTLL